MTKQEYNTRRKALDREYRARKLELATEYAEANRKYNVGDIIEGLGCVPRIRIESYRPVGTIQGYHQMLYTGVRVRKSDSQPLKSGERAQVCEGYSRLIQRGEAEATHSRTNQPTIPEAARSGERSVIRGGSEWRGNP